MEVKPGYKLTEVGVIPEDWDVQSLKDSTEEQRPISYGIVQTGPNIYNGIPCLRVVDIDNGNINKTALICTTKQISDSYRRTVLRAGDLVMPLRGKVGDVGEIDEELAGANLTRGVALLAIRSELSGSYYRHALSWTATRKRLEQSMNGSALQEIPIATLRSFQIGLPATKNEQSAIATALSDIDALVAKLDQLIAKKRDLKQATMQQLLTGRTRLPGFSEEWEHINLGDVFSFKNGLNKAKSFFGYGTPIVNYMDVFKDSKIFCSRVKGLVSVSPLEIRNFDVRKGDVLFTRTSETPEEVGIASVVIDEPNNTVFSGFVLRARPKDNRLIDLFKAYCFQASGVRAQIISKASYTTRALTNGRILSGVVIPVPSIGEQTAIAAILSDLDAELSALEARRDKTRALKQAMMQELLTGRIRLV